jgi:hypothetical protein
VQAVGTTQTEHGGATRRHLTTQGDAQWGLWVPRSSKTGPGWAHGETEGATRSSTGENEVVIQRLRWPTQTRTDFDRLAQMAPGQRILSSVFREGVTQSKSGPDGAVKRLPLPGSFFTGAYQEVGELATGPSEALGS